MSTVSGSQYGVGMITLLVAVSIGIGYYQMFYLPEQLATPDVDEHVLHPVKSTIIEMILGSSFADQQDNYVPKLVNLQLSIDNHVIWNNVDETAHTVTPDHRYSDSYSGNFGSVGVVKPGESYEFLFTEAPPNTPVTIEYHWMTGTVVVGQARF
jgi:plastocyanin